MKAIPFPLFLCALMLTSCGYVGPVLPPSPEIPATITNLSAVERGDKIMVMFTTPARTVDGVAVRRFTDIDLRVGPTEQAPESAKAYSPELPSPSDKDDPQPKPIEYDIAASDWIGQRVSIEVRTSVRKEGHFSAWSNKAVLSIIQPLSPPVVHAEGSADGIVLTWTARDDAQYRIQRQGPNDKVPVELATVNESRYVDVSAQYETKYRYVVTTVKGTAESLASEPVEISAVDVYPPAVPSGLTVLVGPDAVNLAWQRNTEADLQGYYIYRSIDHGAFEKLGELVALPTYVDHNVEHGKTYAYKVSAIDKKGNPSGQSAAVEAQY